MEASISPEEVAPFPPSQTAFSPFENSTNNIDSAFQDDLFEDMSKRAARTLATTEDLFAQIPENDQVVQQPSLGSMLEDKGKRIETDSQLLQQQQQQQQHAGFQSSFCVPSVSETSASTATTTPSLNILNNLNATPSTMTNLQRLEGKHP